MMSPGPTFERVYASLKQQIRQGIFRPGEHIDPASVGEKLASSITPVRDALHRLVGERLVEAPRGEGFRAPILTEVGLRNLYSWNEDILLLALRSARRPASENEGPRPAIMGEQTDGIAVTAEMVFLELAGRSINSLHAATLRNVADRLHPARLIESHVLGSVQVEVEELVRLSRQGDLGQLRRAIVRYHRRRHRAAADLVDALHHLPFPPP